MRLATRQQSRALEEIIKQECDIGPELLMETAGVLCAREIEQSFLPEMRQGTVLILCGPGNNGGDGLVIARHLWALGYKNIQVKAIEPSSPLAKLQKKRALAAGLEIETFDPEKKLFVSAEVNLIVDALLGTGLTNELKPSWNDRIQELNRCKQLIVSIDVPTGLDVNTGHRLGAAVKAHTTLTLGLSKPGFYMGDGPDHVGRLRVLSLGFSPGQKRSIAQSHMVFTSRLARRALPQRPRQSHKGTFGHVLVCAGSSGTWGAGILSSSSAYRMGSGYVTWASWQKPESQISSIPEVLMGQLPSILESKKFNSYLVGPGLGVSEDTKNLILQLKKEKISSVVLDADALTVIAKYNLAPLPASWILTPHAGEMARLLNCSIEEVNADHYEAVLKASQKWNCWVLLKGHRSVLSNGKKVLVIPTGNSALAKAGTGDVLAGMIAALLAQGLDSLRATALAAYLHGLMADNWIRQSKDPRTLKAMDLVDTLPETLHRLRTNEAM